MDINQLVPEQAKRSLTLAATRSGKSTLESAVLEGYHRAYPNDAIYIVDPKRRYFARKRPDGAPDRVFVDGFSSRIVGKRRGVPVYAKLLTPAHGLNHDACVFVVQDEERVKRLFRELYDRADARRNCLLFLDESFDVMSGYKANRDLRRLIQEGGEIGVGVRIINQRPRDIDRIFLTESEYLTVGTIRHPDDLVYLRKNADADPRLFVRPLPPYHWLHFNRISGQTHLFKLQLEGQ